MEALTTRDEYLRGAYQQICDTIQTIPKDKDKDKYENSEQESRPVVWRQTFSAELISCLGKRILIKTCWFILPFDVLLAKELCNDRVGNLHSEQSLRVK